MLLRHSSEMLLISRPSLDVLLPMELLDFLCGPYQVALFCLSVLFLVLTFWTVIVFGVLAVGVIVLLVALFISRRIAKKKEAAADQYVKLDDGAQVSPNPPV